MSNISGIYKITLKTDGRIYIGSSANIEKRWKWHCQSDKQLISRAIRKYGVDNFLFEILEEVPACRDQLIEREQYYLDLLQPFPWNERKGFNLCKKAYSILGVKRSDETRKKMSDSWHKSRDNEKYKKQLSDRTKGDNNPSKQPSVAAKISASKLANPRKWTDEERKQMSISRTGRKYSDQAKENMKKAQQKNNTRSAEAKEKFSLAQRVLYRITQPDGSTFDIYSRELKDFCKIHQLGYGNLIGTVHTKKPYKRGWLAERI